MTKWLAIVKLPNESERELELDAGFTFGRHPRCGCVLDDRTVSGVHALVVEKEGRLHLRDRGSANHTVILNGPSLAKDEDHPIEPGMVALLGKTRVTFILDQQNDARVNEGLLWTGPSTQAAAAATTPAQARPSEHVTVPAPLTDAARTQAALAPVRSPPLDGPETTPAPARAPEANASTPGPAAESPPVPPPPAAGEPLPPSVPDAPPPRRSSTGDGSSWGTLRQVGAGTQDRHAQGAHLAAARPRLVLDDGTAPRIVDITTPDFLVGRSPECETNGCRIDHRGVSARQARIYIQDYRFYVEDLESMNGTYAEVEQLRVERREIRSETPLRFASVAALFVTDLDVNGRWVPSEEYERTAWMLRRRRRVTKSQIARAQEAARRERRHVGEMLIVQKAVDVFTWAETFQKARWMADPTALSRKAWLWIALALVLSAAAGVWLIRRGGAV